MGRQSKARALIDRALSDNTWQRRTLLAEGVDADPSGKLSEAFGFAVIKQYLTPDDIRKSDKRHGEGRERDRDQVGLTHDDYVKALEVLRDPETFKRTVSNNGKPSAEFGRRFEDGTLVVAEVETAEDGAVSIKSAWKKVPGRNHAGASPYPIRTSDNTAGVDSIFHSDSLLVNPDTVSKVTDPQTGEPMVVYHGTNADFAEFKKEYQRPGQYGGKGFFFTGNPDAAGLFGDAVMPVFLQAKTGLIEKRRARARGEEAQIDHIRPKDDARDIWVVFESTQIKSATGNSGEFSPAEPSILRQPARGSFDPNTLTTILHQKADYSTFLHEPVISFCPSMPTWHRKRVRRNVSRRT